MAQDIRDLLEQQQKATQTFLRQQRQQMLDLLFQDRLFYCDSHHGDTQHLHAFIQRGGEYLSLYVIYILSSDGQFTQEDSPKFERFSLQEIHKKVSEQKFASTYTPAEKGSDHYTLIMDIIEHCLQTERAVNEYWWKTIKQSSLASEGVGE